MLNPYEKKSLGQLLVLLLFFITVPLCSWWVCIHKILDQAKKIYRQKLLSKTIFKNYLLSKTIVKSLKILSKILSKNNIKTNPPKKQPLTRIFRTKKLRLPHKEAVSLKNPWLWPRIYLPLVQPLLSIWYVCVLLNLGEINCFFVWTQLFIIPASAFNWAQLTHAI